ncbi:unnamed protein product [Cylindrotheca closterium]|uniref:Glutathione transferase n=1 Tax=Cylindrotheca closterium TaxID=2856 RepID=A0AAD2FIH3_9STRA|nr:unnamed protein product [Cylindrotheca closterium]
MTNRATTRSARGFLLVITTAALTAQAFSTSDISQSGSRGVNNKNLHHSGIQTTTQCQPWRPWSQNQRIARGYSSSSPLHQTRRPGNPITGLFSDMASSISSSLSSTPGKPKFNVDALDQKLNAAVDQASWEDIRTKLGGQQTEEEKAFRSNVEKGIGKASPLNKVRLFDESNSESDIRVTFYRDHASWCPYCQKVWLTLEEKKIPYRIEKVNMRCYGEKTREFKNLQPSGAIPVAIIDGETYNQSNDIIFALEKKFPNKKLLPEDQMGQQDAQQLLRLERSLFSAWMYWLTGSNSAGTKKTFVDTLTQVEKALESSSGGDFFLGKDVSLVDFMFAPFLERMAASMAYFKGFPIRVVKGEKTDFPAVNRWFDAMETLESYHLTKGDFYSHCWDLPPQLGGCTYDISKGEPYTKAINGERTLDGSRGSWDLPLEPHNQGVEPDWDFLGQDEAAAKREAVERLSFNHKAIVRFAARGAGKKGMPPYSAPLSDPNAVPGESVIGSVDTILKLVSSAMLDGVDNQKTTAEMKETAKIIMADGGDEHRDNVIASLAYLRDRIGVPRDMRLPAARQLRAHLNWSIGIILEAK